mmetsp:Transcript_24568/g.79348  ORF Transcript_24568/g.79348 Transcript_24568/m.79348 type:complete len:208 (+) Transcript_24568:312-935(+)
MPTPAARSARPHMQRARSRRLEVPWLLTARDSGRVEAHAALAVLLLFISRGAAPCEHRRGLVSLNVEVAVLLFWAFCPSAYPPTAERRAQSATLMRSRLVRSCKWWSRSCALEPCSNACRTLPTVANGNSPVLMAAFAPCPVDTHHATASRTSSRAATRFTLRAVRALLVWVIGPFLGFALGFGGPLRPAERPGAGIEAVLASKPVL